jgi:hypothetical protein
MMEPAAALRITGNLSLCSYEHHGTRASLSRARRSWRRDSQERSSSRESQALIAASVCFRLKWLGSTVTRSNRTRPRRHSRSGRRWMRSVTVTLEGTDASVPSRALVYWRSSVTRRSSGRSGGRPPTTVRSKRSRGAAGTGQVVESQARWLAKPRSSGIFSLPWTVRSPSRAHRCTSLHHVEPAPRPPVTSSP